MTIERPNTVAGLIEKRREIAGQIDHHRRILNELVSDLDHVDAVIAMFDPDADLGRAKPHPPRQAAFKGEMRRHVLQALRAAQGPITSLDIARQVMEARGLDASDARMVSTVRKRVGACLYKLRASGIVSEVPQAGEYKGWRRI
jgi:hypothetical protein